MRLLLGRHSRRGLRQRRPPSLVKTSPPFICLRPSPPRRPLFCAAGRRGGGSDIHGDGNAPKAAASAASGGRTLGGDVPIGVHGGRVAGTVADAFGWEGLEGGRRRRAGRLGGSASGRGLTISRPAAVAVAATKAALPLSYCSWRQWRRHVAEIRARLWRWPRRVGGVGPPRWWREWTGVDGGWWWLLRQSWRRECRTLSVAAEG